MFPFSPKFQDDARVQGSGPSAARLPHQAAGAAEPPTVQCTGAPSMNPLERFRLVDALPARERTAG